MDNSQKEIVVELLKVALLPVLRDGDASGYLAADLVLSALDQHIKGLDDAKQVAKLLRTYAKHIVEMRY